MSALLVLVAFWLPGLAIGAAIRLRSWMLLGAAPALTYGAVATGTVVIGNLGLRWSVLSFALWVLLLTATCLAASWLLARRSRPTVADEPDGAPAEEPSGEWVSWRNDLLVLAGVVAGVGVGVVTFLRGIGGLSTFNQDWDAPFHANAVRWIAEHGDPLPTALGTIAAAGDGGTSFYPNTYHCLLALLWDRGGLGMPELLNLAALAVIVSWPLGIAALGMAWRMPPAGVAVAAAVSTWFTTFPYDSLWRGPLWPFLAGVAAIPATLAIARLVVVPCGLAGPVGMALALAGLVGLHPSVIFVVVGYGIMLTAALVLRLELVRWRRAWPAMGLAAVASVIAIAPLALPSLRAYSTVTGFRWPEIASPAEAFGQAILFSPVTPFPQWYLGAAAIIGIILMVLHRRLLWLVGAYFGVAVAYAATASLDNPLVNALSGPFYNDTWRIATLLPLAGAIAVGEFGWTIADAVTRRLRPRLPERLTSFAVPAVAAAAVVAVLAVLSDGGYINRNADRLAIQHNDGPTVSSEEIAAYRWIAEQGDPGRVMNDRSDGSVWMYALAGLQPVEWTILGSSAGSTPAILSTRFNRRAEDPAVDRALAELGVRYVVIGSGFVRADGRRAPGLVRLDAVPDLRLVYQTPDAMVYEVTSSRSSTRESGS